MSSVPRNNPVIGAWSALGGLIGVGLLAYAAHGADNEQVASWLNTGGTVLLLHVCAAFLALVRGVRLSALLLILGASLFTAALMLLSFLPAVHIPMMAPIGGFAMMGGWAWWAWKEATDRA